MPESPESIERYEKAAEEIMTPAQKKLSENRERHMQEHGIVLQAHRLYVRNSKEAKHIGHIPDEVAERWPNAESAEVFSGVTEDGREVVIIDVVENEVGRHNRHFMGTINGRDLPPPVAKKIYEKHIANERGLFKEDRAMLRQVDREMKDEFVSVQNIAKEPLWEDLI